jgi:AcrR family transcriptional regulator
MREAEARRGRGRPRGFDQLKALEAAMLTFWRRGYHGTSLDDLVAATHASRASLYSVFGDKKALLIAALDLYSQQFVDRMDGIMQAEPDGKTALRMVLSASADRLSDGQAPEGCLRCNSTLELTGYDPDIDLALDRSNRSYTTTVQRLADRSLRNGQISAVRAAGLPIFVTAVVNGMVTLARSGASRADLDTVIELALSAWDD